MTSLSDLARKAGFDVATNGRGVQIVVDSDGIEITDQLERLLALHVQELCAGVEPVAYSVTCDGQHTANIYADKESAEIAKRRLDIKYPDNTRVIEFFYPASTVAALQARVAELEKWQESAFRAHPNIDLDIEYSRRN